MIELSNSRTTKIGKNKYHVEGYLGAVRMNDPETGWQEIQPRLVRERDGWRVDGTPYYSELKDSGERLFCPEAILICCRQS